jgi:hypothetical protein
MCGAFGFSFVRVLEDQVTWLGRGLHTQGRGKRSHLQAPVAIQIHYTCANF